MFNIYLVYKKFNVEQIQLYSKLDIAIKYSTHHPSHLLHLHLTISGQSIKLWTCSDQIMLHYYSLILVTCKLKILFRQLEFL